MVYGLVHWKVLWRLEGLGSSALKLCTLLSAASSKAGSAVWAVRLPLHHTVVFFALPMYLIECC
jgi:hypothetical protein